MSEQITAFERDELKDYVKDWPVKYLSPDGIRMLSRVEHLIASYESLQKHFDIIRENNAAYMREIEQLKAQQPQKRWIKVKNNIGNWLILDAKTNTLLAGDKYNSEWWAQVESTADAKIADLEAGEGDKYHLDCLAIRDRNNNAVAYCCNADAAATLLREVNAGARALAKEGK